MADHVIPQLAPVREFDPRALYRGLAVTVATTAAVAVLSLFGFRSSMLLGVLGAIMTAIVFCYGVMRTEDRAGATTLVAALAEVLTAGLVIASFILVGFSSASNDSRAATRSYPMALRLLDDVQAQQGARWAQRGSYTQISSDLIGQLEDAGWDVSQTGTGRSWTMQLYRPGWNLTTWTRVTADAKDGKTRVTCRGAVSGDWACNQFGLTPPGR